MITRRNWLFFGDSSLLISLLAFSYWSEIRLLILIEGGSSYWSNPVLPQELREGLLIGPNPFFRVLLIGSLRFFRLVHSDSSDWFTQVLLIGSLLFYHTGTFLRSVSEVSFLFIYLATSFPT